MRKLLPSLLMVAMWLPGCQSVTVGCVTDYDCKGARVCNQGSCQDVPAADLRADLRAPVADLRISPDLHMPPPDLTSSADADMLVTAGQQDVMILGCPNCHQSHNNGMLVGPTLAGDVKALPNSQIYGSNLTPDPDTGLGLWTDAQIIRAITQGIDNNGMQLCYLMPKFQLDATAEEEIVAYLRSIPAVNNYLVEGACPSLPDGFI